MTGTSAVATSYAKALFSLARERGQTEAIGRELETLVELVAGSPPLREFLSRPWIGAARRRAAAIEVAQAAGVSTLARDFFALAVVQGRTEEFGAIAEAYRDLEDRDRDRVRARVRTAVALTEGERHALGARLAREVDVREVIIEEVFDPTLLGGFVAEVGSLVLDGSLDGQLAQLRGRLAAGEPAGR